MQVQETLIQGSEEWLNWRKQGVGASDANIIMGTGHMTVSELYKQKLDLDPEAEIKRQKDMEFIAKKGHRLEAQSRAVWELENDCEIPPVSAVHEKFPYLRASLDGYNEEAGYLWEHKYCGEADFQKVDNDCEVLKQYIPQLLHQAYVTGVRTIMLNVCTEKKDENGKQIKGEFKRAWVKFIAEDKDMKEQNIKIFDFWDHVIKKEPFTIGKDDILELKDKVLGKKIDLYYKTKDKHDEKYKKAMSTKTMENITVLKKEFSDLKTDIFKDLPHNKILWNGHKITESDKITVDYKAAYIDIVKRLSHCITLDEATLYLDDHLADFQKTSKSQTMTRAK